VVGVAAYLGLWQLSGMVSSVVTTLCTPALLWRLQYSVGRVDEKNSVFCALGHCCYGLSLSGIGDDVVAKHQGGLLVWPSAPSESLWGSWYSEGEGMAEECCFLVRLVGVVAVIVGGTMTIVIGGNATGGLVELVGGVPVWTSAEVRIL